MVLPFPDFLAVTPAQIKLNSEGLDEDGSAVKILDWSGDVVYSEKTHTVMTADKRLITLSAKVVIKGDIAPNIKLVSDGTVEVGGNKYLIHSCGRPRNPDGTVHHTALELK